MLTIIGDRRRECSMSARQAQIAALVACGETNREMARALGLSRRTVDTHLAAIFNKLDVSSRSELIAVLSISDPGNAIVPAPATSFRARPTRTAEIRRPAHRALSARQAEIAALISRGKSNREIALALGRSPRTIDAHVLALFRKVNVRSRDRLAAALSSCNSNLAVEPTSQIKSKLPALHPAPVPRFELRDLSERQTQVAVFVASGKSNGEIGVDLELSSRTVAAHVIALREKLNVGSRGELIIALNRQRASLLARRQPPQLRRGSRPLASTP
jgi:DNA-binding NarL/FixJ family response regulator